MNPGPNPLEAFGAAVPALSRALAVPAPLNLSGLTAPAEQLRSTYAPLSRSLLRVANSCQRVEAKRRRAICKLGRRAANRSSALAAAEYLSLESLERLLDAFLNGDALPEVLSARLQLLDVLRADAAALELEERRHRIARLERRQPPSRKPRRARAERRPQASRFLCRPVGSLAPPLGAHPTPDRCNPPRGAPVT